MFYTNVQIIAIYCKLITRVSQLFNIIIKKTYRMWQQDISVKKTEFYQVLFLPVDANKK